MAPFLHKWVGPPAKRQGVPKESSCLMIRSATREGPPKGSSCLMIPSATREEPAKKVDWKQKSRSPKKRVGVD